MEETAKLKDKFEVCVAKMEVVDCRLKALQLELSGKESCGAVSRWEGCLSASKGSCCRSSSEPGPRKRSWPLRPK